MNSMCIYKAVENGVATIIRNDEVTEYHKNGCIIIKEIDNVDVIKVQPTEAIPDDFFN